MKKFVMGMFVLLIAYNGFSMESTLANQIEEKFKGFKTVPIDKLAAAIDGVPEQSEPWSCGLHQAGHVFWICNSKGCNWSFSEPKGYPLSISFDTNGLKMFKSFLSFLKTDEKGVFRVGPTPLQMAIFLDRILEIELNAFPESRGELLEIDLLNAVKWNLKKSMPTLAYYVIDPSNMLMHFYLIVGFNDAGRLLVLDTTGQGIKRLMTIDAKEFASKMNASSIINTVNAIDSVGSTFGLRNLIIENGGSVVDQANLKLWKPYSLIVFLDEFEAIEEAFL